MDIPRAVHNFRFVHGAFHPAYSIPFPVHCLDLLTRYRIPRFFAGAILHHEEMSTQMDNMAVCYSTRQPIGVAGLISPWNLPIYLLSWKIAPAIACGNTVVCKPSEMTPMTAALLAQVCTDAGLPKGVVNIVHGVRKLFCRYSLQRFCLQSPSAEHRFFGQACLCLLAICVLVLMAPYT